MTCPGEYSYVGKALSFTPLHYKIIVPTIFSHFRRDSLQFHLNCQVDCLTSTLIYIDVSIINDNIQNDCCWSLVNPTVISSSSQPQPVGDVKGLSRSSVQICRGTVAPWTSVSITRDKTGSKEDEIPK